MTQLVKRKRSSLPSVVNDFFNTERMLMPSLLDFDGGLLGLSGSSLMPEANIIEEDKDYMIELAAPGLEKKDFNIEMQDGMLTISAEKEEGKKEEHKNFKRREFSYNSFTRSFTLPENCHSEKIEAKYENGVLRLMLPKKEVTISKPAKHIKVA